MSELDNPATCSHCTNDRCEFCLWCCFCGVSLESGMVTLKEAPKKFVEYPTIRLQLANERLAPNDTGYRYITIGASLLLAIGYMYLVWSLWK